MGVTIAEDLLTHWHSAVMGEILLLDLR